MEYQNEDPFTGYKLALRVEFVLKLIGPPKPELIPVFKRREVTKRIITSPWMRVRC